MHGNSHPLRTKQQLTRKPFHTAGSNIPTIMLQHFNSFPTWTTVHTEKPKENLPNKKILKQKISSPNPTKPTSTIQHTAKNLLALIPEEESATIRTAFYEDNTMPKEDVLQTGISNQNLLNPPCIQNNTLPQPSLVHMQKAARPTAVQIVHGTILKLPYAVAHILWCYQQKPLPHSTKRQTKK